MPPGRWLTTDSLGALKCAPVYYPAGADNLARLYGAIIRLCDVWRWEKYGTETPEDTAAAWLAAMEKTVGRKTCMHIGAVFAFAGSTPPDGSLACDGTAYNQTDYPELFSAIGTAYGVGGTGTFRVPDMRAVFPVGAGDGGASGSYSLADTGGEKEHTLTQSEMPTHKHQHVFSKLFMPVNIEGIPSNFLMGSYTGDSVTLETYYAGGGNEHENRPPFMALNFCIQAL